MNVAPQPTDGNENIIQGGFTKETILNSAADGTFKEVTAPISCKGYKLEVTDTDASYSYNYFYQAHYKKASGDAAYTVVRNGEYKAHVLLQGQSVGWFKAETGKTLRFSFVD